MTRSTAVNSGSNTFYGSYDGETISGGAGSDNIYGRQGDDTLVGGTGNDQLSGDGGDDTYVFARGDGDDIIYDYSGQGGNGGNDTIRFAVGIAPGDVSVTQAGAGADLVLTIAGGGRITIWETLTKSDNRIEQVSFADGTVWTAAFMAARAAEDSIIRGSGGADSLYGSGAAETFAGEAGNDYLEGRGGSDVYRYASSDGFDRIVDSGAAGDIDILSFTDLGTDQLELRREGDELFVRDITTGQDIRVDRQFQADGTWGLNQLTFADGTVWDRETIRQEAWHQGWHLNQPTNENLYGSSLDDTIVGHKGNDYLEGRGGSDVYRYASGDGVDSIYDAGSSGDMDTLMFSDLVASQVELRRDGHHLFVRDLTTSQESRIDYQFYSDASYGIEQITFADGIVWDRSAILQHLADWPMG